jgi:hypothetical protein
MFARIIVVSVVAAVLLIAISPILYERITGVGVIRVPSKSRRVGDQPKLRPVAEAYIVGPDAVSERSTVVVPIHSLDDIYRSVGVGPREFSSWQERYGVGTLGRNPEGALFVPDYPVLSKIAWMGIDTIDLSSAETSMLIDECTKAKSRSVDAAASTQFESLIGLAQRAIAVKGTVRFDIP